MVIFCSGEKEIQVYYWLHRSVLTGIDWKVLQTGRSPSASGTSPDCPGPSHGTFLVLVHTNRSLSKVWTQFPLINIMMLIWLCQRTEKRGHKKQKSITELFLRHFKAKIYITPYGIGNSLHFSRQHYHSSTRSPSFLSISYLTQPKLVQSLLKAPRGAFRLINYFSDTGLLLSFHLVCRTRSVIWEHPSFESGPPPGSPSLPAAASSAAPTDRHRSGQDRPTPLDKTC